MIAIVGATVVDGTGHEPAPATVLIRGERIAAVGSNVPVPDNARANLTDSAFRACLLILRTQLYNLAFSGRIGAAVSTQPSQG